MWEESDVLARALALLASGYFDGAGLGALATHLHIDRVELGALSRQCLGAVPRDVIAARRDLFAKRLATDTDLAMPAITRACGFTSLSGCRAALRRLDKRPTSHPRRARRRPAAGSTVTLTLAYTSPYDWPAMIAFLAPRAIDGVEWASPQSYARSIALGGTCGTVLVRPLPRRSALRASIRFPAPEFLPMIVARIRALFDLDADPLVIGRHLSQDSFLAPFVAARPGVRLPGAWDGFEVAVRAILGQEVTVKAASTFANRLATHYGETLPPAADPPPEGVTRLFPSPERIAAATDLAQVVGLPRKRAAAIVGLAGAVAADPSLLVLGPDLETSVARLVALPGVGHWTAHYIAMRVLHEPNAFPAADIGVLRALAGANARPKPKEVMARAEPWRPWRAYAVMHLWTSAEVSHKRKSAKADRKDGPGPRKP